MAVSRFRKMVYEFGSFRLDVQERHLLCEGEAVSLIPKAFDLLVALVESGGRLLDKDELMRRVWPDSFVEEGNLAQNISLIRKALGESETTKFIETVPRRGYRFVASVKAVRDRGADLIVLEQVSSPITIGREEDRRGHAETGKLGKTLNFLVTTRLQVPLWSPKVLAALGLLVVAAAVAFYWTRIKIKPPASNGTVKTIAVLPFKPLSSDSRNESLELGMADTLISKLSGIRQLIVRPVSSVRKYNALDQDPIAAGRELGVDYVLEGSLQMDGEKTRATVRLRNVADGSAVWSETCDKQCSTLLELQDAIAARIASALVIVLTGEQRKQLVKHYTASPEAFQAYAWGRFLSDKRTPQATEKSVVYLEQAIKLDPNYALAYVALAEAYALPMRLTRPLDNEVRNEVKELVARALEIDDTLAEAHAALGGIKLSERDLAGAEQAFKRALELNPNSAKVRDKYAGYLEETKRDDEALAERKRAVELDPTSALLNRNVAIHFYRARWYNDAIDQCLKALKLDDDMPTTYRWLAQSYEKIGLYDKAVEAYLKTTEFGPEVEAAFKVAYAESGWKGFWRKSVELKKERVGKQGEVSAYAFAQTYARLGDKDQAFAWLDKITDRRRWKAEDPLFDDLRSDPRYIELLRRMNLEP